jgi:hypothetical protein
VRLAAWHNAALFRDAALDTAAPAGIMDLIGANLAPAVTGCAVAVRRFLATAKAAIEGLTRAAAVDYGAERIRVNAVALGSIDTERYRALLAGQDAQTAARTEPEMAELRPLGRVGPTRSSGERRPGRETSAVPGDGRRRRHGAQASGTLVTLVPPVPNHMAWMSQPCCSYDVAGTSTPYARSRARVAAAITGHGSAPETQEHQGPQPRRRVRGRGTYPVDPTGCRGRGKGEPAPRCRRAVAADR